MESITETDLIITVLVGTVLMFVLVSAIIFAVVKYQKNVLQQQEEMRLSQLNYQRELLTATISAADKEREQVSMNVHDEISASLNVLQQNLMHIPLILKQEEKLKEVVKDTQQMIDEVQANVRAIYNNLSSPTLRKSGFMKGLDSICKQIDNSGIMKVSINNNGLQEFRFDPEIENQLYRVCKEVMNNIIKYAKTTNIVIDISHQEEQLNIVVKHQGKGITDVEVKELLKQKKGLGLKSIYARMQMMNGEINYMDTLIKIKIPLTK